MPPRQHILSFYRDYDALVKDALQGQRVSCTKGCAHCCRMFVSISLTESIPIAEHLLGQPDYRNWIDRLTKEAKLATFPGVTPETWFDLQRPCAFLRDELCEIYEIRPSPCRYYYVRTPPVLCTVAETHRSRIQAYRFHEHVAAQIAKHEFAVYGENPILGPHPVSGPIPLMILWAMGMLAQDAKAKRYLRNAVKPLESPYDWTIRVHQEWPRYHHLRARSSQPRKQPSPRS